MRAALAKVRPPGLLLAASLGLWSCGQPANSLTGSLGEISPLTFNATIVRASPDVLVVEYDNATGGGADGGLAGTDVVFKMEILIEGLTLDQGLDIDLTSLTPDGQTRMSATRAVGEDPRRNLPPVQRGDLVLDSDVNIAATAKGHFNILFGEGGDIGEGRTVNGTFSALVQDASSGSTP